MGGFEPEATQYRLRFEDPKFAGLDVLIESLDVGDFLAMQQLLATAAGDKANMTDAEAAQAAGSTTKLLEGFAANLIEWNVTKKGVPVPVTLDGIRTQKFDFVLKIITAWMEAIADVAPPLSPSSSGSKPSEPELSLPMAALSPSLTS
jgi:hypothetical protein